MFLITDGGAVLLDSGQSGCFWEILVSTYSPGPFGPGPSGPYGPGHSQPERNF